MNNLDLAIRRNNTARLCRHTSKTHRGCIRINVTNTYEHELEKFKQCWKLAKENKEYITEAEGEDKSWRADILILDEATAIEIIKSESQESIEIKKRKYPVEVRTIEV